MNLTDIDSMQGIFMWYDQICQDEKNYTDQELADKLDEVLKFRSGNNPTNSIYLTHHYRSEKMVERRVKQYCKQNHIKLQDYNGPLPYRLYSIDTIPKETQRRYKLERIMKIQKRKAIFNKIKSIWKHIL